MLMCLATTWDQAHKKLSDNVSLGVSTEQLPTSLFEIQMKLQVCIVKKF